MIAWILLGVYLAAMVCIGIWGMRKTTSIGDFFLGGRSIGPWVSAFAYGTTYFSAVLFIGFAGKLGWKFGLNSLWIAAGNAAFGALAAWLVLGRRTRRMTQNLSTMTMPGVPRGEVRRRHDQDARGADHLHLPAAVLRVDIQGPQPSVRGGLPHAL